MPVVSNTSKINAYDSSDDEGTILKTVQNNKINASKPSNPVKDDRPIKPMKSNIESSFNEDGI
jgi:hypothetical protein